MSEREVPRLILLDLRLQRWEVLEEILSSVGELVRVSALAEATPEPIGILVIDPPARGLDRAELDRLASRANGAPTLVLGRIPPGCGPAVHAFAEPMEPGRLRAHVARLLSQGRTGASTPAEPWPGPLASLVALDTDSAERLRRVGPLGTPVWLDGEPGTGKALLARARLVPPNGSLVRIGPGWQGPDGLCEAPATAFLADLMELGEAEQARLLAWLDEAAAGRGPRLILATPDGEALAPTLRHELRLILDPFRIRLPALREQPERIASQFRAALEALARHHALTAPAVDFELEPYLSSRAWPFNLRELISLATHVLLRAGGRALRPEDLEPFAGQPAVTRPQGSMPGAMRGPRALDALVQELAHEIKNPLVSIKTFTQLLPERFADEEFRDQFQRIVSHDVERIDAVLGELSEFTRLREPRREPVALVDLVERALDNHQFQCRKRSIDLTTELPEPPCTVDTDPEVLAYALDGIVRQVVGSVPEGGSLHVSLRGPGLDTGPRLQLLYSLDPLPLDVVPETPRGERRQVLGLRHTLAAHALALLGVAVEIEDTLEGRTSVLVSFEPREAPNERATTPSPRR